jgi:DNA invertase Pin-like site-specific DNA recombinase
MRRGHLKLNGESIGLAGDWQSDPVATLCEAARLGRALEKVEADLVRHARAGGRSWTEIATALGTTRQAAWQRFASRAG